MRPRTTVFGVCLAIVATLAVTAAPAPSQTASYVFSPDRWDVLFDFVGVGTQSEPQTVVIANKGQAAMLLGTATMTGPHRGDFRLTSDTCARHAVAAGGHCQIQVVFRPQARGTRVAALRFADAAGCANWIHLAGSGTTTSAPASARAAQICPAALAATRAVPASPIVLPRTCTSRRRFRIKLNLPRGQKFKTISVQLHGRHFRVYRGKRITTVIDLRGLPRGQFTLRVRAVTTKGRHYTRSRRYATCGRRVH